MTYVCFNLNPQNKIVSDCAIRAVGTALKLNWKESYLALALQGYKMLNMPNADIVWGELLRENGFIRGIIPNTCPSCYTIKDFCKEHTTGTYVLGTGSHAVAVINGDYYDTWDSGDEVPIFYWMKGS